MAETDVIGLEVIGFTGTRDGLTEPQARALEDVLFDLWPRATAVHHGDCVGADAYFALAVDTLVEVTGRRVERHSHPARMPPELRADRPADVVHPIRHAAERNGDIVRACTVLLACPKGPAVPKGSGTWMTIRGARYSGRRIVIIMPDGSVTEEPPDPRYSTA